MNEAASAIPPARVRRQTTWLLHHAAGRSDRIIKRNLDHPGDRTRYAILAGLDEYGPLSQAELCRRIGIDAGDAVTTLNSMQADGLLRRAPDPGDRRRNLLHITVEGTAFLEQLESRVTAAQEELLDGLPVDLRMQFNALLQRLLGLPPEPHHPTRPGSTAGPATSTF
jgi:MarR family transcriptional regulator, lower aerobic nicotinate degradation pathway regulator